jgi:hypothetical protein
MEIITIQPGQESIRDSRPYPFHVNATGNVQRQDFWKGKVSWVVGFQRDAEKQTIDHTWAEVWAKPELAVGLFVVTSDEDDKWSTHVNAIESATRSEI